MDDRFQEIIPFTAKYSYPPAGAETVFSSPFTALHHPTWLKIYEKLYKDDAVSCLFTREGLQARSSIVDSFSHVTSACQLYYASTEQPALTAFTFEAHIMLTHGCGGIAWGGENLNTNHEYYAFTICREEHFYTLSLNAHTNFLPLAAASLGQDDLPQQQPSVLAISSNGKMQRIYLNHRLLAEAQDTTYPQMTRIALLVGPSGGNQGDLLTPRRMMFDVCGQCNVSKKLPKSLQMRENPGTISPDEWLFFLKLPDYAVRKKPQRKPDVIQLPLPDLDGNQTQIVSS